MPTLDPANERGSVVSVKGEDARAISTDRERAIFYLKQLGRHWDISSRRLYDADSSAVIGRPRMIWVGRPTWSHDR